MRLVYQPEIERLRAIAVLSVLIYHFFPKLLPGGFTGVDIFFVISGYLITRIIWAGLTDQTFSLIEFYRRRIRRIFPALLLVMFFVLIAGWFLLFSVEYTQLGRHTIASSLFLQNLMLYSESGYFDRSAEAKPLLHLWSLSVEEQFYVIWPPLLMLWSQRGWKLGRLLFSLALGSFAFNLSLRHINPSGDFFWPAARFWELLVGALLVLLPETIPGIGSKGLGRLVRGIGLLIIVLGLLFITPLMSFPGFWALLPTTGTVLVIVAGHYWPHPARGHQGIGAYIGRISYPLYLWHWPLLSFEHILTQGTVSVVTKLALMAATFGLASLSYHGLEKPARRSMSWRIPGTLALAMMGLTGWGAATLHADGFPLRTIESHNPNRIEVPIPGFESLEADCTSLGAYGRVADHCKAFNNTATASPTLFLWGDSSAIAWAPVFIEIAKDRGARLIIVGHPSCPPLLSVRKTHFDLPESASYCQDGEIQGDVLRMIEKVRPDLIVFMGALGGYRTDMEALPEDTEFMRDDAGGAANRQTNAQTLRRRIPETLDQLSSIAPVLMFRNWPLLPAELPPPAKQKLGDLMTRDTQARYYARDYFEVQRQLIDEILKGIDPTQVDLFDPSTAVCDEQFCSNQIAGILAYSDRYHITPKAALLFRSRIEAILDHRIRN
jgi:peptidoglycan/LPS O-acetylase OafA/YrhL